MSHLAADASVESVQTLARTATFTATLSITLEKRMNTITRTSNKTELRLVNIKDHGGVPMARIFQYDGREIPDPDPSMTTEQVRQSLVEFYPELSNADTKETKRADTQVFTFSKRVGTKG